MLYLDMLYSGEARTSSSQSAEQLRTLLRDFCWLGCLAQSTGSPTNTSFPHPTLKEEVQSSPEKTHPVAKVPINIQLVGGYVPTCGR